jgi:hypothetical protein
MDEKRIAELWNETYPHHLAYAYPLTFARAIEREARREERERCAKVCDAAANTLERRIVGGECAERIRALGDSDA